MKNDTQEFKKRSSLRTVLFFLLLFLLLNIVLFLTLTTITFILLQQGIIRVIDPNALYIPEDSDLVDLNTLIYRDHELYRYNSYPLMLKKEEDFEMVVAEVEYEEDENEFYNFMTMEEEDVVVMMASSFTENHYEVPCEGVCQCYENSDDDDRRLGSLVFQNRYSSVVLVSLLGFAAAKFVNSHIDECYEAARESLGDGKEITCLMSHHEDGVECKTDGAVKEKEKKKPGMHKWFCEAYCLQATPDHDVEKLPPTHDCEEQDQSDSIEIPEGEDPVKFFKRAYLTPFCATFRVNLKLLHPCDGSDFRTVSECVAEHDSKRDDGNVFCIDAGGNRG